MSGGDPSQTSAGGGQEIAPGVRLPEGALIFSFARSGGPGGQNVNKLATKTRLRVELAALRERLTPGQVSRLLALAGPARLEGHDHLLLMSQDSRSQEANKKACLAKLRDLVVAAMRPVRKRRPTRPSKASKQRRLEAKRRRSQVKRVRGGPAGDE